jgi:ABC-type transporter Mla MlaB component
MKTSKRKRSPKSEPVVEALDTAPAEASAEPVPVEVAATASANEPVVAEVAVVAETVAPAAVVAEPAVAGEAVIVLAANCSVKDAASLKNSLSAVANESGTVTVDASAVERVDTATMQLLCAFTRDRNARNQSVAWRGQSQALNEAVRLLGVSALIGFDPLKGVAA